ncbi:type I restriction endonuclease subunit R [Runella slithyformis]|uniref:Type I restriction enzyme endonuclease subunit n=1 Tax=Runella slithyformis (strain ATCC 29530 / DSM 19594 / LMG 11500 / NCIMB 11436 / LSU 4) TaxID=761193 RepID=A0A7U4E8C8_RUNSL|nr:type I restriction endonuclease subunit R [Runella slithyformis]AEI51573.1 type I site-specific deoxyribonuclease, HsdR family [Runella slithyformis DSM 19594]
MGNLSELNGAEKPVTEWLSKMGWTFKSQKDLKVYERPFSKPIIEQLLIEKTAAINGISQDIARRAVELLLHNLNNPVPILGNEAFLEKLVSGVTLAVKDRDMDVHFIDFEDIWQNDFIVTNQYWVQGYKMVKTDIILLVNGIPLVPIEAKQRAKKGVNWMEGVRQFSTYDQRADKLFMCHAFGVACNGRVAKYGIPGASSSYFNEWKDTILDLSHPNPILDPTNDLCPTYQDPKDGLWNFDVARLPNGEVLERMKLGIIGLLQPARVLDILQHFLVFERAEGKIIKKVARYQQLRAANKIAARVIKGDLNQGVIWHTQGSGKSLTMLYTAYKLRQSKALKDPTIYIVVDRKDLREQIGGTFDDCEFPNARAVNNMGDLKHIIKTAPSGVFITTVQKFDELGDRQDLRDNVIVLIDEAHRSQYGTFQMELQAVLPNAKRFAFTGTPIPKTHQEFGLIAAEHQEKYGKTHERYLDRYSIQDAIDDGATKPIRYTFGPIEWFLDKEKLKQGYEEITAELTEDEKRAVERRVSAWKVFLKHPERVETLAKDIATDFREMLEPQGYKAQIVACDKEACVLYYNELLKYFDRSEMAIIFSTGHNEEGEKYELYKDHYKEDAERKRLIRQFKRRITEEEQKMGNNLKIFIVCNMLLTGFDAPIEQTMYLDSPLRDHNLLQAVARTNRPYDDKVTKLSKEFGRIVDYVGVFQNYKEALNYDPEDIGEFEDVESLVKTFPKVLDDAFEPFESITLEDSYDCTMAIVRKLSEIDHGKFENNFREVVQLWESISPHPALRASKIKYLWLNEIYEIYLEEFKRLDFDAEIYAAKTRKLIEESTQLLDFKGHLPEILIDSDYLNKLKEIKLDPSDKAEKIIRDIETVIRKNEVNSAIYVEFQNRLDELIKQKKAESLAIEEILNQLGVLYTELDEVASLPTRMGFPDKGSFEFYTLIKNGSGVDFNEALARAFSLEAAEKIKAKVYGGWQEVPREFDRLKYEILLLSVNPRFEELKIDSNDELVEQIMKAVLQNYRLN